MKSIMINRLAFTLFVVLITVLNFSACKKWIEVDPPSNSVTSETTFENVNTSTSVLNSVYFKMQNQSLLGFRLGMVGDELRPRVPNLGLNSDYVNEYQSDNSLVNSIWNNSYGIFIYNLNLVIEGVEASKKLSENNKKALIAEAKFTRAFLYFYLVNLYGDVPLVLTTDYKLNSTISRSSVDAVYEQIISDLKEAKADLPENFLGPDLRTPTPDRVRPTKWAAHALLARVYLYRGNWDGAESESSEVINNQGMFHLESLDDVFKKNSSESIWSLQPDLIQSADQSNNTIDGSIYIPNPNSFPETVLNEALLSKFLSNDQRKSKWLGTYTDQAVTPAIDYYYPYKYKLGNNFTGIIQDQQEHLVVLRLAEQYLVRAEARAHLYRITGSNSAAADLDSIRSRAGLGGTAATDQQSMLSAIFEERQLELFSEWGHRWLDLKRTGRIDAVMGAPDNVCEKKGGTWTPYKSLFPIPFGEFLYNPSLRGHQNPGYRENR